METRISGNIVIVDNLPNDIYVWLELNNKPPCNTSTELIESVPEELRHANDMRLMGLKTGILLSNSEYGHKLSINMISNDLDIGQFLLFLYPYIDYEHTEIDIDKDGKTESLLNYIKREMLLYLKCDNNDLDMIDDSIPYRVLLKERDAYRTGGYDMLSMYKIRNNIGS